MSTTSPPPPSAAPSSVPPPSAAPSSSAGSATAGPGESSGNPLDAALAAEDAAIFAYGALGAFVAEDRRAYAASALAGHRGARDWLRERLVSMGAQPGAAAPAYELPDITDAATAARVAADAELALVPRWSAVAGAVGTAERPYCTTQAQACAVRGITWGAEGQAFPGTGAVTMASPSATASPAATDQVSPPPESAADAGASAAPVVPEVEVPAEPVVPEAVVPAEPIAP